MLKDQIDSIFHTGLLAKMIVSGIVSVFGFFFDVLLAKVFLIVIALTLIDCLLGYYRALKDRRAVVSRAMYKYAWKFSGYMIATSTLFLMSNSMPEPIRPLTSWLDDFALAFFAVHEAISIIEHLNEMGVPLPTNLFKNLKKVRDTIDGEELPTGKKK